ncbi:MAG: type II secretion system major pseudopilin GspG [Phycisphaerales bacterium]
MRQRGLSRGRVAGVVRAFTIVEIIVVVVIIGVLATLIVPRLFSRVGQAKTAVAKTNAAGLASQVKILMSDVGGVRSGWSMRALIERPGDVDAAAWKGPYVDNEDALKDPWGREFMLVVPGQRNIDFDIVSYGADGVQGGEGDDADVVAP